jgi:hypothetical protein
MDKRCKVCDIVTGKAYRLLPLHNYSKIWEEITGESSIAVGSVCLCRSCYSSITALNSIDVEIVDCKSKLDNAVMKREEVRHRLACRIKSVVNVRYVPIAAKETPIKNARKRCIFLSPLQNQKKNDCKDTPDNQLKSLKCDEDIDICSTNVSTFSIVNQYLQDNVHMYYIIVMTYESCVSWFA